MQPPDRGDRLVVVVRRGVRRQRALVERDDAMNGRRKAVLLGFLDVLPLIEEIEGQRMGIALGLLQGRNPAEHETQARHALNAFVG